MTKPDDLAYPELSTTDSLSNRYKHKSVGGLTKRELIATKILAALVSNPELEKHDSTIIEYVEDAINFADALIVALNEKKGGTDEKT